MSLVGRYSVYYQSTCSSKKTYLTEKDAESITEKKKFLKVYKCPLCKKFHLTSHKKPKYLLN